MSLNESLLAARYAHYLTLCEQAALLLDVVGRHNKGNQLSCVELAQLLEIDPIAGRSFFNVLVAIGILEVSNGGYCVPEEAHRLLSTGTSKGLAQYLSLGLQFDQAALSFVEFLRNPKEGQTLYAQGGEVCLMDDSTGTAEDVTFGLGSRARRFASALSKFIANKLNLDSRICDLGAGTLFLGNALRQEMPKSRVTMADRQNATRFILQMARDLQVEVLEHGAELTEGQIGILNCNMFARETLPHANSFDAVVLSNVLHDWTLDQIQRIIENASWMLNQNGMFIIHEAFMGCKDAKWMSSYGMALNRLTGGQGSCYYISEYDAVFAKIGFRRRNQAVETTDGCVAIIYERIL